MCIPDKAKASNIWYPSSLRVPFKDSVALYWMVKVDSVTKEEYRNVLGGPNVRISIDT